VPTFALPPLADLLASARVVQLPMRQRFRGVNAREIVLFEGPAGWAEWSPFVEYEDEEAAVWLAAAIEYSQTEYRAVTDGGTLRHSSVAVNATLPAVSAERVAAALEPFGRFETVKIKVAEPGQALQDDLDRIFAVVRHYPDAKIRLDANGGYSVDQAVALANAMVEAGVKLDYLEQPVATIAELAEVRIKANRVGVRVAADESVRKVSDPMAVALAGAADLLVIKAAPLGGIARATSVVLESGLPAVVSSALESSIGISMGVHLAASLPDPQLDSGLGTVALFERDIVAEPLIAQNGRLPVKRVAPDADRLVELAASPERTAWWLARLERCYALL